MKKYRVEIKCQDGTFELHSKWDTRKQAMDQGLNLACSGYDGRVITEKGYTCQEWECMPR